MDTYRGAVLIVGSLWWEDSDIRKNWRKTRLDAKSKQFVYVPIRYGRESTSRGNTYTMVFSQLCYRKTYGLGQALLVPFRNSVVTSNDLIWEARELWKAEVNKGENVPLSISGNWGAIGLLLRPDAQIADEIIQSWLTYFHRNNSFQLVQPKTERPALDQNGLLTIRWPKNAENNAPIELDFILATATVPSLISKKYPSVRTITEAWNRDKENNVRYFHNNIACGITTFQDKRIKKFLKK
jgi:hypothetical protein